MSSRGQPQVAKIRLYSRLWENKPTSVLIYDLSKHFPDDVMDSVTKTNMKFI